MAQNITLMGATYSDVPGVQLPKSGGGTASFFDVSDTTAAAADVAQGKYFYTDAGVRTAGTASGGGGGAAWGVLRSDAQVAKKWTDDYMAVADAGLVIPSYSTSAKTLASPTAQTAETLDFTQYSYLWTHVTLVTPQYNNTSRGAGRQEYLAAMGAYEIYSQYPPYFPSLDGNTHNSTGEGTAVVATGLNIQRLVYWNTSTTLKVYTSGSYGASAPMGTPSLSGTSLTTYIPGVQIRGNNTYGISSTYWNYLTDIRIQYICKLWKIPLTASIKGWYSVSSMQHIIDDILNNNGTLTE